MGNRTLRRSMILVAALAAGVPAGGGPVAASLAARPLATVSVHARTAAPRSAAALLRAGYLAARARRSFTLRYGMPISLFAASPSAPIYWVVQTPQSSRAVERYALKEAGKTVIIYTLFTARRTCTWYAPGHAPPGTAGAAVGPQCSVFNAASYNAEVFPFLTLRDARLVGQRRVEGMPAAGVAGHLVQVTSTAGASGSFDWGPVTVWIATTTLLPVAITATGQGHTVVLMRYLDWNSPTVKLPPGTPPPRATAGR